MAGTIRTDPTKRPMERVGDVFTELAEVARVHSPELICVEGWNYQSERSQGPQGLWISRLIERLEARIALPFLELDTVTIKRCLGVRSKDEVRRALMARGYRIPVPPGKRVVPDHEWDALAVAVVGARGVAFREQIGMHRGTPTAPGRVEVSVCGEVSKVSYTTSDTADAIATRIGKAIRKTPGRPNVR